MRYFIVYFVTGFLSITTGWGVPVSIVNNSFQWVSLKRAGLPEENWTIQPRWDAEFDIPLSSDPVPVSQMLILTVGTNIVTEPTMHGFAGHFGLACQITITLEGSVYIKYNEEPPKSNMITNKPAISNSPAASSGTSAEYPGMLGSPYQGAGIARGSPHTVKTPATTSDNSKSISQDAAVPIQRVSVKTNLPGSIPIKVRVLKTQSNEVININPKGRVDANNIASPQILAKQQVRPKTSFSWVWGFLGLLGGSILWMKVKKSSTNKTSR